MDNGEFKEELGTSVYRSPLLSLSENFKVIKKIPLTQNLYKFSLKMMKYP